MNSGLYTAYSGLRAQVTALDRLSNNLANLSTVGFKEGRSFFTLLNRTIDARDSTQLSSVINSQVTLAEGAVDEEDGSLLPTGRDLDLALSGNGYLTIDTPRGIRYTRNGRLILGKEGVLSTADGSPVLGENGPIRLGPGKILVNEQGGVYLEGRLVDRLKLAAFSDPSLLQREGKSLLFPAGEQIRAVAPRVQVHQGYLEQSNVNAVASVVGLVEILRHFEAIQKSVQLLMNDINAKAIEKLGR
ncbi:MAG: flagellar hook-basal body protein [Acidobacteria bacterium]|nr:flagellar hook-basal body protein [Acidobacteriota bacterium]